MTSKTQETFHVTKFVRNFGTDSFCVVLVTVYEPKARNLLALRPEKYLMGSSMFSISMSDQDSLA